MGGFVGNSSIQSGEGQRRQATLQLKVPAARYAQALSGLGGIGKLVSSTTEAQDVGEEYVDVTARMSNARRLEERLLTLLATRTGKLEDVLSVERELARVREEIERFDGRLRYLRANVAVSTLAVTLAEPGPVVGEPGSNVIVEAFKQAWRNFVTFIAGLIAALGILAPLFVLAGLAFLAWRRWGRNRHRDACRVPHLTGQRRGHRSLWLPVTALRVSPPTPRTRFARAELPRARTRGRRRVGH